MSEFKPLPLSRLILLFAIATFAVASARAQTVREPKDKLPAGNYKVFTLPYMGAGYESLPVTVTSVTTEVALNGGVSTVGVENRAARRVDAVRFGWYLSRREDPGYVLLQGETAMHNMRDGLAPGEAKLARLPVVSFAKIWQPLARKGVVNGNYLIYVGINEVLYDDGTTQTFLPRGKTAAESKR